MTGERAVRQTLADWQRTMEGGMRLHGSCVAREGDGVLILGPSGSGKSDLTLRLLGRGFTLVADDQVDIADGRASPPEALAGLLEVRGLGIVRLPYSRQVKLSIVIALDDCSDRLPEPEQYPALNLPMVRLRAASASAPDRVALALDCALGRVTQHAGAFAP
jgi:HPr kinase/phosphorylase